MYSNIHHPLQVRINSPIEVRDTASCWEMNLQISVYLRTLGISREFPCTFPENYHFIAKIVGGGVLFIGAV